MAGRSTEASILLSNRPCHSDKARYTSVVIRIIQRAWRLHERKRGAQGRIGIRQHLSESLRSAKLNCDTLVCLLPLLGTYLVTWVSGCWADAVQQVQAESTTGG